MGFSAVWDKPHARAAIQNRNTATHFAGCIISLPRKSDFKCTESSLHDERGIVEGPQDTVALPSRRTQLSAGVRPVFPGSSAAGCAGKAQPYPHQHLC